MTSPPLATAARAVLAVALLIGFYLVGLGLIAGLGWLAVWLWLTFPGEAAQDVSYLVALIAAALVVPAWKLLRARPEPPPEGVPVSPGQAPELWSQVHELAAAVGTRPPDEIRLCYQAGAWVYEDARMLGLRAGRRHLYVGVPLLQGFGVGQLRAVLAHELGHYSHHHTRLGAVTYRSAQIIIRTIEGVDRSSLARLVFSGYGALYFLVSLAVMRRMELEADRSAVRAAGPAATTLALRETPRLTMAWDAFLAGYTRWNRRQGYTPAELLAWFGWLVEQRLSLLVRVGRRLTPAAPRTTSPWDSHPSIEERLAMIEREPGSGAAIDTRPATALVPDADTLASVLDTPDFDQHMQRLAQVEAEREAGGLYRAAARVAGVHRQHLGNVLDLFADAQRVRLRRALPPEEEAIPPPVPAGGEWSPGGGPDVVNDLDDPLVRVTLAAVAATAVDRGWAYWRHTWSEPLALVHDDVGVVELEPLVARACRDVNGVPPLRELLLDLGVHETSVFGRSVPGKLDAGLVSDGPPGSGSPAPVGPLLPDELFLLCHTASGKRRVDFATFHAGLAAAVLAELRLCGRLTVADNSEATVRLGDATPTGDRFLDSVLARVAADRPRPVHQWLQDLGPDVADAVARRVEGLPEYRRVVYENGAFHTRPSPEGHSPTLRARASVARALTTVDTDTRDFALSALLWGTELAAPVLGWRALGSRFWLSRMARQDRLAVAIRSIMGLYTPLPRGGGAAPG